MQCLHLCHIQDKISTYVNYIVCPTYQGIETKPVSCTCCHVTRAHNFTSRNYFDGVSDEIWDRDYFVYLQILFILTTVIKLGF